MRLVEQMGGRMQRVVVTELRESTYYAVIEVEVNGRELSIDARPSDAIALAVRGKIDIFASEAVLSSSIPGGEDVRPLDVQWRAPDVQLRRRFERVHETGSLPAI
jgi:bifunctional DNase/RNase